MYLIGVFSDWIDEVWTRDFCDIEPIPDELKAILVGSTELPDNLVQLHDILLPWVNGSHQLAPTQSEISHSITLLFRSKPAIQKL